MNIVLNFTFQKQTQRLVCLELQVINVTLILDTLLQVCLVQ